MSYLSNKLMKILAIIYVIYAQECYTLKFKDLRCEILNKELLAIPVCSIKAIGRTINEINIVLALKQPWRDIQITAQTFKKANGFKPWLYNMSFDACNYIKYRNNPIINFGYSFIKSYTNANHSCPYDNEVVLKKFRVYAQKVTLPIPEGEYMALVSVTANGIPTVTIKGSVEWLACD